MKINIFSVVLVICVLLAAIAFTNVFFTGEGYHNGIRTGKIFFLLEYSMFAIPIAGVLLIWNFRQSLDWLSVILIAFIAWIFFVGREGGIWQDEKAWFFFTGTTFFILVRTLLTAAGQFSSPFVRWIMIGLTLAIVLIGGSQALLGELQVIDLYPIFHSTFKITGTFFNPGPYAGFLIASLPFCISLVYIPKTNRWFNFLHWIGLLSSMVILAVLPATQSRAAWIGLFVSGGYFLFHHFKISHKIKSFYHSKKTIALTLSFTLFLVVLAGLYGMYVFKQDSADGRLLIWKASCTILKKNTWTGTGFNTFQAHFAPALAEYFGSGHGSKAEDMLAGNVQWAFNEPLQFGVELGIPGVILYLGIVLVALFFPIKEKWKKKSFNMILLAARSSLIAIFFFGLFSYPFYSSPITLLFFFSLGIVASSLRELRINILSYATQVGMLIFLMVAGYHIYGKITERKHAYWLWDEAESLYQIKAYEAANESFEEALPILRTHGLFMQQFGKCLQMVGKSERARDILEQSGRYYKDDFWYLTIGDVSKELGNFKEAEEYYKTATNMVPHKLYPKYVLAKFYEANGQMHKAKKIAFEVLHSEIKVMSTAVWEIQKEMQELLNNQMKEN